MTRGGPRAFDTDRALEQATALFWRRGYRVTTTRDREAAIGVAPSSLYHASGSKSELLDATLSRYQEQLDRELLARCATVPPGSTPSMHSCRRSRAGSLPTTRGAAGSAG